MKTLKDALRKRLSILLSLALIITSMPLGAISNASYAEAEEAPTVVETPAKVEETQEVGVQTEPVADEPVADEPVEDEPVAQEEVPAPEVGLPSMAPMNIAPPGGAGKVFVQFYDTSRLGIGNHNSGNWDEVAFDVESTLGPNGDGSYYIDVKTGHNNLEWALNTVGEEFTVFMEKGNNVQTNAKTVDGKTDTRSAYKVYGYMIIPDDGKVHTIDSYGDDRMILYIDKNENNKFGDPEDFMYSHFWSDGVVEKDYDLTPGKKYAFRIDFWNWGGAGALEFDVNNLAEGDLSSVFDTKETDKDNINLDDVLKLNNVLPEDESINVELDSDLKLVFEDSIKLSGTGSLKIIDEENQDTVLDTNNMSIVSGSYDTVKYKSGVSSPVTVEVNNNTLVITNNTFKGDTRYSVQVSSDFITSTGGDAFDGITDNTIWNFRMKDTVAPKFTSLDIKTDDSNKFEKIEVTQKTIFNTISWEFADGVDDVSEVTIYKVTEAGETFLANVPVFQVIPSLPGMPPKPGINVSEYVDRNLAEENYTYRVVARDFNANSTDGIAECYPASGDEVSTPTEDIYELAMPMINFNPSSSGYGEKSMYHGDFADSNFSHDKRA